MNRGAQWLSLYTIRLEMEGLLVRDSLPAKSMVCVLEQATYPLLRTG